MSRRSFPMLAVAMVLAAPALCPAFDGPLRVRNHFPPFLAVVQPALESAVPADALVIGLAHSSVFVIEESAGWRFHLDMELTELTIRFQRRLAGLFEAGFEVPFYRPAAGFLDGFLEWYHDALGFPDYGRSERPENDFLFEIARHDALVVRGVNGRTGIGDVRLWFKRALRKAHPAVSIAASIELPTGQADTGYGSGGYDGTVALLADGRIGDAVMVYLNAGVVFPGDLRARQEVELRTAAYGGVGIEGVLGPRWSLVVQAWVQGSPYPETQIRQIDSPAVLFAFGARYRGARSTLDVSLTEDPGTRGAPDFIVHAAYSVPF